MNDAVASHLAHLLREVYLSYDVIMCSNDNINAVCFLLTIEDLTNPHIHWAGGIHFTRYTTPDDDHRDEFPLIGDHHHPFVTAPSLDFLVSVEKHIWDGLWMVY